MQGPGELFNVKPRTKQIQQSLGKLIELATPVIGGAAVSKFSLSFALDDTISDSPSTATAPTTVAYPPTLARKYARRLLLQKVPLTDMRQLEESTGWDLRVLPSPAPDLSDSSDDDE